MDYYREEKKENPYYTSNEVEKSYEPEMKTFSNISSLTKSNSIFAKITFLLLILIAFLFFLQLATQLISYFLDNNRNITLYSGLKDARKPLIINQDPNMDDAKTVLRSNNQEEGIEFTYSVWLYINDLTTTDTSKQYFHVFHKGTDKLESDGGIFKPNNTPGVYLKANVNTVHIIMSTFDKPADEVDITNIPLKKWINLILVIKQKKLEIYLNGEIKQVHTLSGIPKQNYGNIYLNQKKGFDGFLSDLKYYGYALGQNEIDSLSSGGPNLTKGDITAGPDFFPPYLSLRWYLGR